MGEVSFPIRSFESSHVIDCGPGSVPDGGCAFGPRKRGDTMLKLDHLTMKHEQEISLTCSKPLRFWDHQSKLNDEEIDSR